MRSFGIGRDISTPEDALGESGRCVSTLPRLGPLPRAQGVPAACSSWKLRRDDGASALGHPGPRYNGRASLFGARSWVVRNRLARLTSRNRYALSAFEHNCVYRTLGVQLD